MRSFTTAGLPGRCQRCWIRLEHCICPHLPRVQSRTEVVVVRHAREAMKSTGTVRVAALALPQARVLEYGEDTQPAQQELASLVGPGTHVLLPSPDGPPVDPRAVTRLVVLDGTWRQARRMYTRLPALHGLPKLSLPSAPVPALRLRESPTEEGRSTLEAIADALELLEGEAVAAPLRALHADFVERVLKARGVWEQKRRELQLE